MKLNSRTESISTWIAAAVLLAFAVVVWLPAVDTPFWGDDYVFLQGAHQANIAGEPWWSAFWPETPFKFWRPLSQESWWRVVDAWLGADAQRTHWANLTFLALSAGFVGFFALTLGRACGWPQPAGTAVLGGVIYGSLALHLLPVHWAAAANNSMLVVFTALILAAWIAAPGAKPFLRALLLSSILPLLSAALLCKESAALIPLLMVALTLFVGTRSSGRAEKVVWFACLGLVTLWLVLRARFTADTDPQYELVLDVNLIRNGLSLVAWLLNVPREALRLLVTDRTGYGLFWAAATALPMAAAWAIACRQGLSRLTPRQWILTLLFSLVAYAPYFPLVWNSYAYYAAIAAMLPTIALARGLAGRRSAIVAAVFIGLSSWLGVAGTRWLDHPGLIGRARWAEATFQSLAGESVGPSLWVRTEDPQRFYALGAAGLAWRLGLKPASVHVVDTCPEHSSHCLVIDREGHWSWKRHTSAQN
jgi:hypothetical protein